MSLNQDFIVNQLMKKVLNSKYIGNIGNIYKILETLNKFWIFIELNSNYNSLYFKYFKTLK